MDFIGFHEEIIIFSFKFPLNVTSFANRLALGGRQRLAGRGGGGAPLRGGVPPRGEALKVILDFYLVISIYLFTYFLNVMKLFFSFRFFSLSHLF